MQRRLAYERAGPAVMRSACERVRTRLLSRPPACRWPVAADDPELGRRLYCGLADVIGVGAEYLLPEDPLQGLLVAYRTELADISDDVWNLAGFTDRVEPFAYDLMYLFEHGSNRRAWTTQWERIDPRPQNEEQWIDYLMSLSVEQFIDLAMAVRKVAV